MDIINNYGFYQWGYSEYIGKFISINIGGGDTSDVAEKINEALKSVKLRGDSDLEYTLEVNGSNNGTIKIPKDKYLKDVVYDKDSDKIKFTFELADGEKLVEVDLSDLNDQEYAKETFLSKEDAEKDYATKEDLKQAGNVKDVTVNGTSVLGVDGTAEIEMYTKDEIDQKLEKTYIKSGVDTDISYIGDKQISQTINLTHYGGSVDNIQLIGYNGNNFSFDQTKKLISIKGYEDFITSDDVKVKDVTVDDTSVVDENGVAKISLKEYAKTDDVNTALDKKVDSETYNTDKETFATKTDVKTELDKKVDSTTYEADNETLKKDIPTKVSQLENDSKFITDADVKVKDVTVDGTPVVNESGTAVITLTDYAKKTEVEDELKKKQDKLTAGKGIKISDDNEISSTLDLTLYKAVTALPTEDIDVDKIYLVVDANSKDDANKYTEYIYVNSAWEKVGEYKADVDLTDYYTKEESDNKYVMSIKGITVNTDATTKDIYSEITYTVGTGDDSDTTIQSGLLHDGTQFEMSADGNKLQIKNYDKLVHQDAFDELDETVSASLNDLNDRIIALEEGDTEEYVTKTDFETAERTSSEAFNDLNDRVIKLESGSTSDEYALQSDMDTLEKTSAEAFNDLNDRMLSVEKSITDINTTLGDIQTALAKIIGG